MTETTIEDRDRLELMVDAHEPDALVNEDHGITMSLLADLLADADKAADQARDREIEELRQRAQRAEAKNAIARKLAKAIIESHPYDSAADGVACLNVWRSQAVRLLQPSQAKSKPQQAHGDALAALHTLIDAATDESGWLWPDVAEHEASKIRRRLTASGVPYGYALVPVEPTGKMKREYERTMLRPFSSGADSAWRNMIAAAPSQHEQGE